MLKVEMENVVRFHLQQHALLGSTISLLQSVPSLFNWGAVCLLKIKQHQYETMIKGYIQSFPRSLNIPEIPFCTKDCTTDVFSSLPATQSNIIESSDDEEDGDSPCLIHTNDLDSSIDSDDSKSNHMYHILLMYVCDVCVFVGHCLATKVFLPDRCRSPCFSCNKGHMQLLHVCM